MEEIIKNMLQEHQTEAINFYLGKEHKIEEIEAKLLQVLEWKGCDSCTHRMTGMCYYSKSFFYLIAVNETTSCIHHKKGE